MSCFVCQYCQTGIKILTCGILIKDILPIKQRKPADVLYVFSMTAYEDCLTLTTADGTDAD